MKTTLASILLLELAFAASAQAADLQSPVPPLGIWPLLGIGVLGVASRLLGTRRNGKRTSLHEQVRWPAVTDPAPEPELPRTLKSLTWDEFELLAGEVLRRKGCTVELSAGLGADGGVDLELRQNGERVLVQCKNWSVYKVGVKEVREFFGVLVSEKAPRGIFITAGDFTRSALEFTRDKPIQTVSGTEFKEWMQEVSKGSDEDLLDVPTWSRSFVAASSVTLPVCPSCKSEMVLRTSRHGEFWGCTGFPRCRGKRNVRCHIERAQLVAK